MKFRKYKKPMSNDQIVLLMVIAQSVIILGLVIFNLIIDSYLMLAVVVAYFILNLASAAIYLKTKNFNLWTMIFIILGTIDILFLFFNGGNAGSGLLWSFLFPFLIFFIKGHKAGLFYSIGYFTLLILINSSFNPVRAVLANSFVSRLILGSLKVPDILPVRLTGIFIIFC